MMKNKAAREGVVRHCNEVGVREVSKNQKIRAKTLSVFLRSQVGGQKKMKKITQTAGALQKIQLQEGDAEQLAPAQLPDTSSR